MCAVVLPADPLVMDNGQDLVTMCCHAYESPDGADEEEEEEELVDYCKLGLGQEGRGPGKDWKGRVAGKGS